ncbi:hypothetical protein TWF718_000113 [Orbilia javanica]|uniref:Uncharacterized protein n=1 Tax=Orbilia javanica TaxID=47235 RepID=A0AAN8P0Q4_9PEZI
MSQQPIYYGHVIASSSSMPLTFTTMRHWGAPWGANLLIPISLRYPICSGVMAEVELLDTLPTILDTLEKDLAPLALEARKLAVKMVRAVAWLKRDLEACREAGEEASKTASLLRKNFLGNPKDGATVDPSFQMTAGRLRKFFISLPTKKAIKYVLEHQTYGYNAQPKRMLAYMHGMVDFVDRFLTTIKLGDTLRKKLEYACELEEAAELALLEVRSMLKEGYAHGIPQNLETMIEGLFQGAERMHWDILATYCLTEQSKWYQDDIAPLIESFGENSVTPVIMVFNDLFRDLWQSEANPNGPRELKPLIPGAKSWDLDSSGFLASIKELCRLIKVYPMKTIKREQEKALTSSPVQSEHNGMPGSQESQESGEPPSLRLRMNPQSIVESMWD